MQKARNSHDPAPTNEMHTGESLDAPSSSNKQHPTYKNEVYCCMELGRSAAYQDVRVFLGDFSSACSQLLEIRANCFLRTFDARVTCCTNPGKHEAQGQALSKKIGVRVKSHIRAGFPDGVISQRNKAKPRFPRSKEIA